MNNGSGGNKSGLQEVKQISGSIFAENGGGMKTILVVEDEASLRVLLEHELTEMGYRVKLSSNGLEALEMIRKNKPDLVILDIMMPEMDGLEALREILNEEKKIPVIINSAYSHYKDNFLTWAAESYVVKSSDLSELKAQIQKYLPVK